jgi:predicted nucleotidyltransferase
LHWYAESEVIQNRLYDTPAGSDVLIAEGADVQLASANLLGIDVATTIGPTRRAELLARWPGDIELLQRELTLRGGPTWPTDPQRRHELIAALTRGLSTDVPRSKRPAGAEDMG